MGGFGAEERGRDLAGNGGTRGRPEAKMDVEQECGGGIPRLVELVYSRTKRVSLQTKKKGVIRMKISLIKKGRKGERGGPIIETNILF